MPGGQYNERCVGCVVMDRWPFHACDGAFVAVIVYIATNWAELWRCAVDSRSTATDHFLSYYAIRDGRTRCSEYACGPRVKINY